MTITGHTALWMIYLGCTVVAARIAQVHISFGSFKDSLKVVWSTDDDVMCQVLYWTSDEVRMREGASQSELQTDNWNAMKYIHMAEMQRLLPGQNYTYKILCDHDEASEEFTFKSQLATSDRPVKFLVCADMGYDNGRNTVEVLKEEVTSQNYDAIWHVGDISYDLETNGGAVGDNFMKQIQPIAARVPYMTAPGNHELANSLHHYRTRFSMPGVHWPMPIDHLWYSYDVGPVHLISFSSEVYFIDNEDYVCQQFDWLLEDLTRANQNRATRPWIVALGHRPMYCSNSDVDDCTGRIFGYLLKRGLEDLFHAQGVDLIIQGHEHSYERLWPVYNFKVLAYNYHDPQAPVHIISGAAGCSEGGDPMGSKDSWSAFTSGEGSLNSYGRLHVFNSSHLYYEQVKVGDRQLLDSVWIIQSRHGPNVPGLNCSSTHAHVSCTCPPPLRYVTLIVMSSVVLTFGIGTCVYCGCMWRKQKRPLCFKFCSCRRRHPRHVRLLNVDDDDDIDNPHVALNI